MQTLADIFLEKKLRQSTMSAFACICCKTKQ